MPVLILMRHANAEPAESGMRDFDRPLSAAGRGEANLAVKLFETTGLKVIKTFCSTARRTKETLACFRQTIALDDSEIIFDASLYSGEIAAYQNVANTLIGDQVGMIVGHNPMIERFAADLVKTGDHVSLDQIKSGFPTAAIAVIDLRAKEDAAHAKGALLHFFTP